MSDEPDFSQAVKLRAIWAQRASAKASAKSRDQYEKCKRYGIWIDDGYTDNYKSWGGQFTSACKTQRSASSAAWEAMVMAAAYRSIK